MIAGDNIRKRRLALGKTLEDVAVAIGVSRQTMSRYETGIIKTIPPQRVADIANALNTTGSYIFGYIDDPDAKTPAIIEFDSNLREYLSSDERSSVKEADEALVSAAHVICMRTKEAPDIGDITPDKIHLIAEFIRDNDKSLIKLLRAFELVQK